MKTIVSISSALLLCLSVSCTKENSKKAVTPTQPNSARLITNATSTFAYGSDVSWVTQMESSNLSFYNRAAPNRTSLPF